MKPDILETCPTTNALPRLLQIYEVRTWSFTDNHVGIPLHAWQRLQDFCDGCR